MSRRETSACAEPLLSRLSRTIVLWSLSMVTVCQAQIVTASISGMVVDPSGAAVENASISLVHTATGALRRTVSDATGHFLLAGLDAGHFKLTISKTGFKSVENPNIILSTGDRLSLGRVMLELGAVTETIAVTAQPAMVQTYSAERSDVITSRQVDGLLVRGRNVTDLLVLVPGVVVASQPEDLSSGPNFYVQGNRRTMNNVAIDGVPSTDMGNGFQLKLLVSQDAVAEVKILVSNYQAEYGRMSGSNLQIVTKSGTREFHGLGSFFKRHEQFNANNFFNNRNGVPKPRYRYNTWTYNVGGPVFVPRKFNRDRDKLFFFWQQEFWPTKSASTGRVTVPTELERRGDFSQTLDISGRLVVLKDPFNLNAPFPNNTIPPSRVEPNGQALLKFFPLPNFFDRTVSGGQYNYVFTSDNDIPKKTASLKLDYNINSNNTLTGSFNASNEDQTGAHGVTTATANWPQMRKTWWSHAKSVSTRYTRVISPTIFNEFSFGWLSQPAENSYTEEELRRNQRDTVGFRAGQLTPKANPLNIVPNATFGGVPSAANIDTEGRFPLYNRYHLFNWSDNFTWMWGPHTFKAGVYVERFYRHQKKAVNFAGRFDFSREVNNPLDTNWAYSNAALGVFRTYSEISDEAWMRVRTGGTEAFLQDNWKVTRKLTLDLGLRLYWLSPLYERDDWMAGFVPDRYDPQQPMQLIRPGFDAAGRRIGVHPVTGQQYVAAQIGGIAPGAGKLYNGMVLASDPLYPRGMIRRRSAQWGPRFGFAYDLFGNGRTALRGGFGAFYNRHFTELFSNTFVGQPPLLQEPIITYGEIPKLLSSAGLVYPSNVFATDADGELPMVMNYSFSIQQDLGFQTTLDVAYAGSLGRHLLWRRDFNPVPLGANFDPRNGDPTLPGRALPAAFLRPIPGYNNIEMIEPASSSNYHSMQVSAKRRFVQNLQFGLAWTWSKAMDFNDTDTEAISPLVSPRVWNYGLAAFDRTHVFTFHYLWELPKGPWRNPLARGVLNHWQLSGITSFVSGQPLGIGFSTTTAIDITGTPSQSARIVVLENPVLPKSERTFSRNFRTEVFRLPAVGTLGNAAKTLIRGPGINNWDIALFKNVPLREQFRLQFRFELYNAFNHTQFSGLDTTARFDPRTGEQVNARFGEFTSARPPRQLQFALRLYF